MKYDVVIVGSGIGGLASGILLAAKGKKVLILERNESIGGRLCSKERDGFIVDFGVHLISRSYKGPLGELFKRAGHESKLKFNTVRPVTSYNGKIFKFPQDLEAMTPAKDYEGLKNCLAQIYGMTEEQLDEYDTVSIKDYVDQFTKNDLIHACFNNISGIYCGAFEWEMSAAEFMRCLRYERKEHASGYPVGGCGRMVEEMLAAYYKHGGELRNLSPVEKIIIKDNKATGVMVKGETIEADSVIVNSDMKAAITHLIGEKYFTEEYIQYIKDLKWCVVSCVVRLALDKKVTDIQMLTQIGNLDTPAYYDDLINGREPERLNFFMVSPSNLSEGIAPDGKQLINICVGMPIETPKALQDKMDELMISTMEQYVPDLRKHIIWKEFTTREQIDAMLGEEGAGIGIGQNVGQTGKYRPSSECSIENLYFVSGEAGGRGCATEMIMTSALECIDKNFA